MHLRHRVQVGPLAGGDGYLRHALPSLVLAVVVHIAGAGHRVVDGRADDAVRGLVHRRGQIAVGWHAHPGGAPGLPVSDERCLAVPGADGGYRVGHVDDEGRAADIGAVGEHRLNAEILRRGQRRESGSQHAVNVAHLQTGVVEGVVGCLGVVLQRRLAGHVAHYVGLGNTHDGDVPRSRRSHNLSPNCN